MKQFFTLVITFACLFLLSPSYTWAEVDFGSPFDKPNIRECGGCDGFVEQDGKFYPEWHEERAGDSSLISPTTPSIPPIPATSAPLPTSTCNSPCTNSAQCPQNCPVCAVSNRGQSTCQAVTVPSVTPPTVNCNAPCSSSNQCPQNCPVCAVSATGQSVCQALPTPTRVFVPCNTPCTDASQCPLDCPQCAVGPSGQAVCKALCDQSCSASDQCPLNCPLCVAGANGRSSCQPAKCQCDGLDVLSGNLAPGQSVTFVVYIKVDPNNPTGNDAEARTVIFRLERKVGDSWQEIANSGVIAFAAPTLTPVGPSGIRRYAATWTTTIPQRGSGVTAYRVRTATEDIVCGVKPQVLASPTPLASASASTTTGSFFTRLLRSLSSLLGLASPTEAPPISTRRQSTTTNTLVEIVPTEASSIQLGTFDPATSPTPRVGVRKQCRAVEFEIRY